jgi:hypothetical protein
MRLSSLPASNRFVGLPLGGVRRLLMGCQVSFMVTDRRFIELMQCTRGILVNQIANHTLIFNSSAVGVFFK